MIYIFFIFLFNTNVQENLTTAEQQQIQRQQLAQQQQPKPRLKPLAARSLKHNKTSGRNHWLQAQLWAKQTSTVTCVVGSSFCCSPWWCTALARTFPCRALTPTNCNNSSRDKKAAFSTCLICFQAGLCRVSVFLRSASCLTSLRPSSFS